MGRGTRSWDTIKGSQIRKGRSSRGRGSRVRKAQEKQFWRQECRDLEWHSARRRKSHRKLSDPLPSSYFLLPEPEGPPATTRQVSGAEGFPLPTQHGNRNSHHDQAPGLVESHQGAGNRVCPSALGTGAQTSPQRTRWLAGRGGSGRKWPLGSGREGRGRVGGGWVRGRGHGAVVSLEFGETLGRF